MYGSAALAVHDARGTSSRRSPAMLGKLFTTCALVLLALPLHAKTVVRTIDHSVGGTPLQSILVYDDAVDTPRPGIVMAPDWMGVNQRQVDLAAQIAGTRYVILIADVYGTAVRPKDAAEAGAAARAMYADRSVLRARMASALEQLRGQAGQAPLDGTHWGAIGFCFGGAAALDLARSGADLAGVASFHGSLGTDDPALAKAIRAQVLVMNGADDTYVSADEIRAFEDEMRAAKVDWQFVNYGGAVHCFAIPTATGGPAGCRYDERTARRAYARMNTFFTEAFAAK